LDVRSVSKQPIWLKHLRRHANVRQRMHANVRQRVHANTYLSKAFANANVMSIVCADNPFDQRV